MQWLNTIIYLYKLFACIREVVGKRAKNNLTTLVREKTKNRQSYGSQVKRQLNSVVFAFSPFSATCCMMKTSVFLLPLVRLCFVNL